LAELKAEGESEDDLLATPEEGKSPSFSVLLHGSLKVFPILHNTFITKSNFYF
jgi:hypothetical protein